MLLVAGAGGRGTSLFHRGPRCELNRGNTLKPATCSPRTRIGFGMVVFRAYCAPVGTFAARFGSIMSGLVGVKNISGEILRAARGINLSCSGGALPVALRGIPLVSRFALKENGEQIPPNVAPLRGRRSNSEAISGRWVIPLAIRDRTHSSATSYPTTRRVRGPKPERPPCLRGQSPWQSEFGHRVSCSRYRQTGASSPPAKSPRTNRVSENS